MTQQSVFVFGPGKIAEKDYESIEIDGGSKGKIREELARRFDIVEQHLFRDFPGFVTSHAHDRPYRYYTAEDYYCLGLTAQKQGVDEEAKEFYGRVLELNQQHQDARQKLEAVEKRLARAEVKAGKDTAKQLLTVAKALGTLNTQTQTRAGTVLAAAAKALGTPDKELAATLKALGTLNTQTQTRAGTVLAAAAKALGTLNKGST